jgi:hypothetical protein
MNYFMAGLCIGFVIGGLCGAVLIVLCIAASKADEQYDAVRLKKDV